MLAYAATLSVSQNCTVKENHQIFKSFNPTGPRFNDDGMGCQSVAGIAPSVKFTQCLFVQQQQVESGSVRLEGSKYHSQEVNTVQRP